jgi:hypothetical protein
MGPNGFGGTLAAPIWRQYMEAASGGYCGDFPLPTTPWSGTAFFGPHAAGGPASNTGTGTGTGSGSGSGSGGAATSNPYKNPTLFAQPTTPSTSGTGGTAPTSGGQYSAGSGGGTPPGHSGGHGGGNGGGGGGGKTH